MTFIHSPFEFTDLISQTSETGKRQYVTPEGNHYPSVTTVLSAMQESSFLDSWRERVGNEEADKISNRAKNRGTQLHKIFEDYVNNSLDISSHNPIIYQMFKASKSFLDNNVTKINNVEFALYSNRLKIAGRCDLLCEWNNVQSILDFKSATKPKKEEWIHNYFLQCTIYAMMVYELLGIKIPQIVVFIMPEGSLEPQIFVKQTSNYMKEAIALVRKYHEQEETVSNTKLH